MLTPPVPSYTHKPWVWFPRTGRGLARGTAIALESL